ncbi:unnamed protein product [Ambrosiozyma monospora]|uniref:Unnamed protein product n=1 Tax=Ambrosiozyma monospora TaxID=43982 RepID=A0ACB5TD06_AMBMO|nr:unnamed protein product [Ambrosiozyma monospora]
MMDDEGAKAEKYWNDHHLNEKIEHYRTEGKKHLDSGSQKIQTEYAKHAAKHAAPAGATAAATTATDATTATAADATKKV